MHSGQANKDEILLRTDLRPGDLEAIVAFHGRVYSQEYGFDETFEDHVAGPLACFAASDSPRQRIWIAEQDVRMIGCIAIVEADPETAQLRWFLVDPSARGRGLGKRLVNEAVAFSKHQGYRRIILWTVSTLTTAAHVYRSAGLRRVEEKPGRMWGVEVVEEKYELQLRV
jgi:GNAT superfamily N-acetyltransferase